MRRVWAAAFLLRRVRSEPGVALMLVALVGVTAFLFAAAPRLLNQVSDGALRHELASARATQRNLQVTLLGNIVADEGGPALRHVLAVGDDFRQGLPPALASLIDEQGLVLTSVRFRVEEPPVYDDTFISLRHQDGLDGLVTLVAGRLPQATGQQLPEAAYGFVPLEPEPGPDEPPEEPPLVEIALSEATAQATGVNLGDLLAVTADAGDPRLPGQLGAPLDARFEVVGIFGVSRPDAEVWYEDSTLQVLNLGGTDDHPLAFATALMAPEAYADVAGSGLPFTYQWRYFIDPQRLDGDEAEALLGELRRVQSRFLSTVTLSRREPSASTGLAALLEAYLARRSASRAVLSVAAIGPFVLAAGAIGMVGVLLVARRRPTLALARGRGASGLLLLGAQAWEATLLLGVAVAAGFLLAIGLVPARASPASPLLAAAVGASAGLGLVAATWPVARRPLRDVAAEQLPTLRPSPRRLVLEATAVVVAVAAILLLQQRGLAVRRDGIVRFDPFLAATPALAGLAVGIVAVRLYPIPIRALGWLAARRRDLVPVLGLRTVGRHPAVASLPLLVLLLAAAFGAFTSTIASTIERGQLAASWDNLGADYRVDRVGGGPVGRVAESVAAVDGLEAVAAAFVDPQARFSTTPNQRGSIVLYALEAQAYGAVLAGSPIALDLPAEFGEDALPGSGALGGPQRPIPALLSRQLPSASLPVEPGDTFEVEVAGQLMTFRDVGERVAFPGLPDASTFVIAPLEPVREAYARGDLQPTHLFLRGRGGLADAIQGAARSQLPAARVTSRYDEYDALRRAPLVAAVSVGFRAALLVAAAYTALAVVAGLTLSAASRSRDLAFLRTLGVSARQSLLLTVVEHGPPVVIALLPGVALGVGVAHLLAPALGLSAFAGTDHPLALAVPWAELALVSAALSAVVAAAIGLSAWLARRARPTDALRMGDD